LLTENIFEKEFSKESVFFDRNLLSPHFIPKELPFRNRQMEDISSILAQTIKGKKADNLFIFGKTGTGKTSVTRRLGQQLTEFSRAKNLSVEISYVNCRNHNSKYRVLIKIVKDFFPNENFLGFSSAFIYEKLLEFVEKERQLVIILDEIDKIKDMDDLIYSLSRANDEIEKGSISIIGISNNVTFKDRLGPRTKSSLCQHEMVFPPYNAQELFEILSQRARKAFKKGVVEESAISLASAISAKESGDARTALMLLLRAGEIADRHELKAVTDKEVLKARKKVEEEIFINMISTLPEQEQLVLLAIANLSLSKSGYKTITGKIEEGVLFSGEIYKEYERIARNSKNGAVSTRWYREYIGELEMYGLIFTTNSGKGFKGQSRLIKLGFEPQKIKEAIEKEIII